MGLSENTILFRFIIWLDRGLNVLTGGSFQECLSTRTYILSETLTGNWGKWWIKVKHAIDWLFWEGHCYDSFIWEMQLKQDFIDKHTELK